MDFLARLRTTRSHRRMRSLVLSALMAAVTSVLAAPAHAHPPYTVKAWGVNAQGQLGNDTTASSNLPVSVKGLSGVTATASGEGYSLALLEDGTVMAWGENSQGQLGDGTTAKKTVPVPVCMVAELPCAPEHRLKEVTAISAGLAHSLALLRNHTVVEWGHGANLPTEKSGLANVTAITTAGGFSFAVLGDGTVMAWGENSEGQLGDGTTEASTTPVAVCAVGTVGPCPSGPFLEGVRAVAAGTFDGFALALLSNETVAAWGANRFGELGNGTRTNSNVPVTVKGLSAVTAIAAGGLHALALQGSGTVDAWGSNEVGQLGNGSSSGPETCGKAPFTFGCSDVPVAVAGLRKATSIAAGQAAQGHSLALVQDGAVYAWGYNHSGQLGDGTSEGPEHCGPFFEACAATPVNVSNIGDSTGIGAGGAFSVAFGPPPTVTALSPPQGADTGGTSVTITGLDFSGATSVKFGSTEGTLIHASPTSITVTSPAGPVGARVHVTVTNSWGTSSTSPADLFGFTPTVTGLSPSSGSRGTSVTVTGTGFAVGSKATRFGFGNKKAHVHCSSSTTCTVLAPGHKPGVVDVTARVSGLTSPVNRPADQFTYH
jgi:alpha-tubulin suppressor-like RCC1 family protein